MAPGTTAAAEADIAKFAGGDCTSQTGELAAWIVGLYATHPQVMGTGPLNIYTGLYLDGEGFVRASVASDLLVSEISRQRGPTAVNLLYIDTPTHAHVVPADYKKKGSRFKKKGSKVCGVCAECAQSVPRVCAECAQSVPVLLCFTVPPAHPTHTPPSQGLRYAEQHGPDSEGGLQAGDRGHG